MLTAGLLTGCADPHTPAPGAVGVTGFVGAVTADEPQAALIGRDTLIRGGSAVDAAVAMYFAMAVTLPSQASLGGGGACLTFERSTNTASALTFPAGAPVTITPDADRPTAVPANVRGFFALQALYGKLHWSQLLAPAETLARFGIPVSRALANDLAQVADALAVEPEVRRIFARGPDGPLVGEGDLLYQSDLASVIARIRATGPNDFYTGPLATQLVAAVREAGGTLALEDLKDVKPIWQNPLDVGFDDWHAYFTPLPAAGGVVAGQIWAMLVKDDRWTSAPGDKRDEVLVDAAIRSFADQPKWGILPNEQSLVSSDIVESLLKTSAGPSGSPIPVSQPLVENPAAATFAAIDGTGNAIACAVTLNSLFGTGRVAAGTGIILAALPGSGGRGSAMLGPMLVVQPRGRQFVWAGAAAGGVTAPTALAGVAARTLLAGQPLDEAIAAARVHGGSDPRLVFVEPGVNSGSLQTLLNQRDEIVTTNKLGRVNAIVCPDGIGSPEECRAAADPRGFGLATRTD